MNIVETRFIASLFFVCGEPQFSSKELMISTFFLVILLVFQMFYDENEIVI